MYNLQFDVVLADEDGFGFEVHADGVVEVVGELIFLG